MANALQTRSVIASILLGALWYLLLPYLYVPGAWITVGLMQVAHDLGVGASAPPAIRIINAVLWSLILGLLFGVPLGLLVQRRLLYYWLLFIATRLAIGITAIFWDRVEPGMLLLVWTTPETWAYSSGVLLFAALSLRVRERHASLEPVAP